MEGASRTEPDRSEASSPTGAQAVDRALQVLALFDETRSVVLLSDVVEALGVHRTTASRIVAALVRHRLLEPTDSGRGYVLGLGLVSLAGHVLNRFPVRAAAGDLVRDLRSQTEETVWLGVIDGDEVIYIDQASSPRTRVNVDWVGYRQPLAASVTGAVLLAHQSSESIAELLAEARGAPPEDGELTEAELTEARRRGYLARYGGVSSTAVVAAPIRDHRGEVVAALTLSAARHEVDAERFEHELVPATRDAADRISERMGAPVAVTPGRTSFLGA